MRSRTGYGKPLLASEALMDELAPLEPAARAARTWCLAMGALFVGFGVLSIAGLRSGGHAAAVPALLIGIVSVAAGLSRVSYRQRAVAMMVLGLTAGPVGLQGTTMATAAGGVAWGSLRVLAAIALAAALLFRARYRAYLRARLFLAVAFACALPFLVLSVWDLAENTLGMAQAGAIVAIVAVAAALAGFMGAQTTAAGSFMAPAVVLGITSELALRALAAPGTTESIRGISGVVTTALGFLAASALGALGVFQILAWRFAGDARRIDIHSPPPEEEESPESQRDEGDWGPHE